MDLHVPGQFDDAEDDSNLETNQNILTPKLNQNSYQIQNYSDDEIVEIDDALDYLEFEDLEHESARTALNIHNFEVKVDLTFKNKQRAKVTDKSDNATYDRVLDNRSLKIMYKMMRQKEFETVNGCISAGKEANVYHAPSFTGEDLVLKVYMTSIMPFKRRQNYMRGDNRFKNVSLSSSTKIVTVWAEKEFRNLNRIYDTNGAIPCPRPIKQKGMVVLMSMIGENGDGAPRLKDVNVNTDEEWSEMYAQVVGYVRILYQECHLIHGDLSEYNLLYHNKKVYVIDVSQSVEHEHPNAFKLLRQDCNTINIFFRHKNIPTLSIEEFFFFVIGLNFCSHTAPEFRQKIDEMIAKSTFCVDGCDEGYFMDQHIERRLGNVTEEDVMKQIKAITKHPDRVDQHTVLKVANIDEDMRNIRSNIIKSIKHHKRALKIKKEMLKNALEADETSNDEDTEEANNVPKEEANNNEDNDSEKVCEDGNTTKKLDARFYRPKGEDTEEKKLRKKLIKEAQKEARVTNKQKALEDKFRTVSGFKYKNMLMK